ncbi:hypothetical protein NQU17_08165 [Clostridiaceae bacterium HFYG-1003]|nr:hypothetical protein NQU17_08165 [Clostridiaceae bacterium HFYG-1003]
MGNELAKALKRKTDAQFRVTSEDQAPGVVETPSGQVVVNDPSAYMVPYVAGKNVSIGNSGSSKVINAIMNILAGDNVSVSAPDENGAVRISSSIGGKSIDLTGLTDGYVLTYDSLTDTIMLKPAAGSISQATDTALGGIKAAERTTESSEVKIDATTGKLYAPSPDQAANGLPAGGSAGQVLSKIDNEDYNAQWVSQSPISTGANPIDEPPSSPSPMDDEFDDITLDPKWIWINQGAATWVENGQSGMMDLLSGVDHTRLLVQAAPSGDFIALAKISILCPRLDYMNFGICLYNNTNGKRVILGKCTRNNYSGMQVIKFNSDTQYSSDPYLNGGWDSSAVYVRIKKNGTSYSLDVSIDGSFWWTVFTEYLSVFITTITHVGLGYFRNNANGVNYKGKCEFFRVTNL